jgi:phenylalanyl-tRNA synthetase beta chain
MLISRNWLKKYVKLADTATAEEIASKLTLSTVEVEGYKNTAEHFDEIVVGKILAIEKHPQADKLQVCLVDVGTEKLSIVCGGSNLVKNMLVAVAKVGAFVAWHGEGDLVKLKPVEIRGVASAGMICGADEIGLATFFPKKQEKEILDISFLKVKPGTPVAKALELQDIIFEIDNKSLSNRPDLWSHYGLAREVAVLYNREVAPYQTKPIKEGKEMPLKVKIEEYKLCSRYMAVALSGIVVEESPLWLKRSLSSVGIRPINTIVDITNYVMTDIGQPMHAFDARYFPTQQIIIRKALEGEKLTTLDGHERVVSPEMLVIANEEKPLAVAGIMGGSESGITTLTDTIVFESANFDATSIRKTSSVLGLRSDSSVRFEKSLDPELCQVALQKAVELVLQICPNARVVSKVIDSYPRAPAPRTVQFPVAFIAQKLGIEIPLRTIVTILKRLGFEVKEKNSLLTIDIPSWRATKDITTPEDVVEEILRIYGYHQVPSQLPLGTIAPPEVNGLRMIETNLREVATKECAYTEVYNYSFVSEHQIKALGDACENYIELDNPLSKEKPFLRRNLLISLLENVQHNQEMYDELAVYEIGKTYLPEEAGPRVDPKSDELLPRQDTWFTAVYRHKKDSTPFWKVRRILETHRT